MARIQQYYAKLYVIWLAITLTTATNIRIGIMMSGKNTSTLGGVRLLPALEVAQETISHLVQTGEYANFSLQWFYSPTGCSGPVEKSLGVSAQFYYGENVAAFIGPTCSSDMIGVGDLAASFNVPVMSGSASRYELDNKDRYPTVTQLVFKPTTVASFLKELFFLYGWDSYVLIQTPSGYYSLPAAAIEDGLRDAGIRSYIFYVTSDDDFDSILEEASYVSRSKYENKYSSSQIDAADQPPIRSLKPILHIDINRPKYFCFFCIECLFLCICWLWTITLSRHNISC